MLLSTGRTPDPADLGPLPPNVHAEAWVDQDQVLGQAALVICHGGAGTTFGALGFGLPVVFVPIMADQALNARLVTSAGAGIVIDPGAPRLPPGPGPQVSPDARPGPGPQASEAVSLKIRAGIETIMTEPSYRRSARRIAERSRAAPVIDEVLGWLARTAAGRRSVG